MNSTYPQRLKSFISVLRRRRLDAAVVFGRFNIRALTGVDCDNAALLIEPGRAGRDAKAVFYTDFRYEAMVHRTAPWLAVGDIRRLAVGGNRIGYEPSISHARFMALSKAAMKSVFVDIEPDIMHLRSIKSEDEIARIRLAEETVCGIWNEASAAFKAGMTERDMARIIRRLMIERGDGEAFDTIVCVGANAAECHHVPDDTVWNGREPVLVDMGVRLDGVCSDLTRCIAPKRSSVLYDRVYRLVEEANRAAIAAVRPGLTCGELDRTARRIIVNGGFGKCFGHSLGHGVGYEIHEAPTARKGDKTVLKPGMVVTVEPGIYLEGNLGVRIEDLVLVTETGCEVLSRSAEKARKARKGG